MKLMSMNQEKPRTIRLPIAPAMKCAQWPLRLGCDFSTHFLVDSITPKYVAPVAREPVTPGVTPL